MNEETFAVLPRSLIINQSWLVERFDFGAMSHGSLMLDADDVILSNKKMTFYVLE